MTTMRHINYYILGIAFVGACFAGDEGVPATNDITIEIGPSVKTTPRLRLPKSVECTWGKRERIHSSSYTLLQLLAGVEQVKTGNGLQQQIIHAYRESPSAGKALFLGLYESDESERVLLSSLNDIDDAVRENIKVALARRGHEVYEKEYIDRFRKHPISNRLSDGFAESDGQLIWNALEYIGTPGAIIALYDAVANWSVDSGMEPRMERGLFPRIFRNMRHFLSEVGYPVPNTINSPQEVTRWWIDHREQAQNILKKNSDDLPRHRGTMFIISLSGAR